MPKPEMISTTPRTISQMPTTNANVTIESNGYASTTKPARTLTMPKKIAHPRPGSCLSAVAFASTETPRTMKPTPIQIASRSTAYPSSQCLNAKTPRTTDATPLMTLKILLDAEAGKLNPNTTIATPDTTR